VNLCMVSNQHAASPRPLRDIRMRAFMGLSRSSGTVSLQHFNLGHCNSLYLIDERLQHLTPGFIHDITAAHTDHDRAEILALVTLVHDAS
jgi:hypothetical protein